MVPMHNAVSGLIQVGTSFAEYSEFKSYAIEYFQLNKLLTILSGGDRICSKS